MMTLSAQGLHRVPVFGEFFAPLTGHRNEIVHDPCTHTVWTLRSGTGDTGAGLKEHLPTAQRRAQRGPGSGDRGRRPVPIRAGALLVEPGSSSTSSSRTRRGWRWGRSGSGGPASLCCRPMSSQPWDCESNPMTRWQLPLFHRGFDWPVLERPRM